MLIVVVAVLIPNTSFLGHLCGVAVGYLCSYPPGSLNSHSLMLYNTGGFGYLKFLAPPEKILRWVEGKLNLLGRLPHYVSIDQKTYGRYGVLPTATSAGEHSVPMTYLGSTQRLGP